MNQQPKDGTTARAGVPDKVEVLKGIIAGKSLTKMEREFGMPASTLSYHMGKWGWKGIKADRAQQLLDEMKIDGAVPAQTESKASPIPQSKAPSVPAVPYAASPPINTLQKDLESEKAQLAHDNETAARILAAEIEQSKLKDAEIQRLRDELATRIGRHNRALEEIEQLKSDNAHVLALATEASENYTAEIEELKGKFTTLEREMVAMANQRDVVQATAGNVECIDAIEAATVGLVSGQAYITGAAIESLWHWNRKGGIEDLQKAALYVNRLIDSLELQ